MLQADLCLFLHMFAPDCGLFTKHKNKQWKFVEENLLQVLSKASINAKEEQFTCHHADLQEQLEEAEQEDLQWEDNDNRQEDLSLLAELMMRTTKNKTCQQSMHVQASQSMLAEMTTPAIGPSA